MLLSKSFKQPAILVGNGINNYAGTGKSYRRILADFAQEEGIKECEAILDDKAGITYSEFYQSLITHSNPVAKTETEKAYLSYKEKLRKELRIWQGTEPHEKLVSFARQNNIPILTTNYDATLLTDEIKKKYYLSTNKNDEGDTKPSKIEGTRFTHLYPVHSYYSDRTITDVCNSFGIWHIHGCLAYKQSLIIGIEEYYRFIRRIGERLGKKYQKHENDKTINDNNSWLDIFLHNDLLIVGIDLGSGEIGLRWLLNKRYNYQKNRRLSAKTLFVHTILPKEKEIGPGKCFYFNNFGIDKLKLSPQKLWDVWDWE